MGHPKLIIRVSRIIIPISMDDEDLGHQLNYLLYTSPVTKLLAILILLQILIDSVISFLPFLQTRHLDVHRHSLPSNDHLALIDLANNP